MSISLEGNPALVLIDFQKGFEDISYWGGQRNNPAAEANAARLLHYWRENNLPVIHIQHCSSNPDSRLAEGQEGNEIKDLVKPLAGEPVIKKNVNSAFIGTDLKQQLDDAGISQLVIAGLTTDHCVSTTTRMAGNYGYETFLVADACATFNKVGADGQNYPAELIHDTALASLHNEFAIVMNTDELIDKLKG
ncbi:cysteine hydrolase [Flavihumibacter rivuli]|uniref:cysteine hydrolase family protein n=1 Tax=Flavihumibacter rivuli TaxID=2838156 RepID=UPI001BDDEC52|nr:cysteine hydrolase family protein [Flavihumibacter rivuli]ULQ57087.1 cysteine hydrolase [Flavihumibacter rivuli]